MDICERLRLATLDCETGERLYPGVYGAATIEELDEARYKIAELEDELARLRDGRAVILPETRQHAKAMHGVAEAMLKQV